MLGPSHRLRNYGMTAQTKARASRTEIGASARVGSSKTMTRTTPGEAVGKDVEDTTRFFPADLHPLPTAPAVWLKIRQGFRCLRAYAHKFSPKKFTQPQLFACLVLKTFLKTDYRGLAAHLAEHSDLRAVLGLEIVPHFTTQKIKPVKQPVRLFRTRNNRVPE
jgi:hypothetical protein